MPELKVWNVNADSSKLPPIGAGDRLVLHMDGRVWRYKIQADVLRVNSREINARVMAIFDRDADVEVQGSDVLTHIGSDIVIQHDNVFQVLKRPA